MLTLDDRVELIEGDIVSKSPGSPRHASVKSWLSLSKHLILLVILRMTSRIAVNGAFQHADEHGVGDAIVGISTCMSR